MYVRGSRDTISIASQSTQGVRTQGITRSVKGNTGTIFEIISSHIYGSLLCQTYCWEPAYLVGGSHNTTAVQWANTTRIAIFRSTRTTKNCSK